MILLIIIMYSPNLKFKTSLNNRNNGRFQFICYLIFTIMASFTNISAFGKFVQIKYTILI